MDSKLLDVATRVGHPRHGRQRVASLGIGEARLVGSFAQSSQFPQPRVEHRLDALRETDGRAR